jgi:hypothetical protein
MVLLKPIGRFNGNLMWRKRIMIEVHLHELQLAYSMLSIRYSECFDTQGEVQRLEVEVGRQKEETQVLSISRNNLDELYKDAFADLTTLRNSHNLTMSELDRKWNELVPL